MRRIKSVQVIGGNYYYLGCNKHGHDLLVGEIIDRSDSTSFVLRVFDTDGELMVEIINCPVEVEYEGKTATTSKAINSEDIPF